MQALLALPSDAATRSTWRCYLPLRRSPSTNGDDRRMGKLLWINRPLKLGGMEIVRLDDIADEAGGYR